jgi:hypothetical protein
VRYDASIHVLADRVYWTEMAGIAPVHVHYHWMFTRRIVLARSRRWSASGCSSIALGLDRGTDAVVNP